MGDLKALGAGLGAFVAGLFVTTVIVAAVGSVSGAGLGSCGFYGPDWGVSLEMLLVVGGPLVSALIALLAGRFVSESRAESNHERK
jgi:hypothetical protein